VPVPEDFPEQIRRLPPFDGPFDAFRLAAEGCDVLFASYPAGTQIADHEHVTDNVGVITSGELRLTIDGVETRYGCGDWYRVPPGVVHAARFDVASTEIELWFRPQAAG
jgi:quercetin dioxygenase-like cupin family protein